MRTEEDIVSADYRTTCCRLNAARNAVFEDSLAAAADLGWEITYRDADQGLIEATDTTAIFRFVDDVIIRIRSSGKITVVDVRSKSRDGQGDLGVNAARVQAFIDKLIEGSAAQ